MTPSKGEVESLHMTYATWLRRISETPEWLYCAFGVRTYLRPQVSFVVAASPHRNVAGKRPLNVSNTRKILGTLHTVSYFCTSK
jgi:hypothetical protein